MEVSVRLSCLVDLLATLDGFPLGSGREWSGSTFFAASYCSVREMFVADGGFEDAFCPVDLIGVTT